MAAPNRHRYLGTAEFAILLLGLSKLAGSAAAGHPVLDATAGILGATLLAALLWLPVRPQERAVGPRLAAILAWVLCWTWYAWFSEALPLRFSDSRLIGAALYVLVIAAGVDRLYRSRVAPSSGQFPWALAICGVFVLVMALIAGRAAGPLPAGTPGVAYLLAFGLLSLAADKSRHAMRIVVIVALLSGLLLGARR